MWCPRFFRNAFFGFLHLPHFRVGGVVVSFRFVWRAAFSGLIFRVCCCERTTVR